MDECYPLEGRKVNLNRRTYFIHGIVHGTPSLSLSKEFKEEVVEKLKGYDLICEDGISEWIPGSRSFNETDYFGFDSMSFFDYFRYFGKFVMNKFFKKHPPSLVKKLRELKSLEDLSSIRKELFANYPPEPEGMNQLISKCCGGTLENPKGDIPLRVKRYLYEAKEVLNYSKEKDLDQVHIVVGCSHELPLEYLIKNNYLLDRLDS